MKLPDHAEHIRACARGDKAALRALFEAEGPRLFGMAMRIVRRADLAEEAVQDGFVQIWVNAHRYDARLGSARGWIYSIIRYRALNIMRDENRQTATSPDEMERLRDSDDADSSLEVLPDASRLRDCLQGIDEERRKALLMSYVLGLTHGEVAGRMAIPLGTAKSWIRKALAALRECMR